MFHPRFYLQTKVNLNDKVLKETLKKIFVKKLLLKLVKLSLPKDLLINLNLSRFFQKRFSWNQISSNTCSNQGDKLVKIAYSGYLVALK